MKLIYMRALQEYWARANASLSQGVDTRGGERRSPELYIFMNHPSVGSDKVTLQKQNSAMFPHGWNALSSCICVWPMEAGGNSIFFLSFFFFAQSLEERDGARCRFQSLALAGDTLTRARGHAVPTACALARVSAPLCHGGSVLKDCSV